MAVKVAIVSAFVVGTMGCSVTLKHQMSSSDCVLGETFGCDDTNSTMWVSKGCRGKPTRVAPVIKFDAIALARCFNGFGFGRRHGAHHNYYLYIKLAMLGSYSVS